jgi:hypothetical protein
MGNGTSKAGEGVIMSIDIYDTTNQVLALAIVITIFILICCCRRVKNKKVAGIAWSKALANWNRRVDETSRAAQGEIDRTIKAFMAQQRRTEEDETAAARKARLLARLPAPVYLQEVRSAVIGHRVLHAPFEAVAVECFNRWDEAIKARLRVLRPVMKEQHDNYEFDADEDTVDEGMPSACCCWRVCCCVCRGHETEAHRDAIVSLDMYIAAALAKTDDGTRAALTAATARGYFPELVSRIVAATVRESEAQAQVAAQVAAVQAPGDDYIAREMTAVAVQGAGGAALPAACFIHPSDAATMALRDDLHHYQQVLRRAVLTLDEFRDHRAMCWIFDGVGRFDKLLHGVVWDHRVKAMRALAEDWREATARYVAQCVDEEQMVVVSTVTSRATAADVARQRAPLIAARVAGSGGEQHICGVTMAQLEGVLNDYVDAATAEMQQCFMPPSNVNAAELQATRDACCNCCLGEYPAARRLSAGQQLEDSLQQRLIDKVTTELVVTDVELGVATQMVAGLKTKVLDRLYPLPEDLSAAARAASPSRARDDGMSDAGDDEADEDEFPDTLPPMLRRNYLDSVNGPHHAAIDAANAKIAAFETNIAVMLCREDPAYAELRQRVAAAAQPYLSEIAFVVSTLKQITRCSQDLCAVGRQRGSEDAMARQLQELQQLLHITQVDGRFREYLTWLPLDAVRQSMAAHASRLRGA